MIRGVLGALGALLVVPTTSCSSDPPCGGAAARDHIRSVTAQLHVPPGTHRSRILTECDNEDDEYLLSGFDVTLDGGTSMDATHRVRTLKIVEHDLVGLVGDSGWRHPATGSPYVRHAFRKVDAGQAYWLTMIRTSRLVDVTVNTGDSPW